MFGFISITTLAQLNQQLYNRYDVYREKSLSDRRFKHEDIMALLSRLGNEFSVQEAGKSVEGRSIKMVTYGQGPERILLWSQMHGDEPTATQALADLFQWLASKDDGFDATRKKIRESLTLYFIPMLNPDGAARFTRRNVHGIDINRDAIRLQTPEGRILKRVRDSLQADWAFNLHDQGRATSVNGKPASVSLLAPPYNESRQVNQTRGDAMKIVQHIYNQLLPFIPGNIGIYNDEFEPRAFGDNIQKWGSRTVLIESGGYQNDWERQEIRKLNFVMLLSALESMATGSFRKLNVKSYYQIPKNSHRRLHELIITNLNFDGVIRDVAMDRREIDNDNYRHYYAEAFIADLGDLQTSQSYLVFDATGLIVEPGKLYNRIFESVSELMNTDITDLMKQGYTEFVVQQKADPFTIPKQVPVNVYSVLPEKDHFIRMGSNPSLVFKRNGVVTAVLINGIIHSFDD
jgi:hypothetical protein